MHGKLSFIFILLIMAGSFLFAQNDSTVIAFDVSVRERLESLNGMNAKNYSDPNGLGDLNDKILFQLPTPRQSLQL
jgi:hypothetical protein